MNPFQLIISLIVLLILFGLINMTMNYVSRRDGEPAVPFRRKLWLIPLMAAFIVVPIELFSVLYARLFPLTDASGELLAYTSSGVLLSFPLLLLIGFLIFEGFVHPVAIALLRLGMRRDAPVFLKQAVTILTDTVLIYVAALTLPAVAAGSWLQALAIAVCYHVIEWILIGVQAWMQQRKHAKAPSHGHG